MTFDLSSRSPVLRQRPLAVRASALGLLLVAELVVFGVAFDIGDLPSGSSPWLKLLSRAPRAIAVFIAIAAATGLFGGKPLWNYAADAYEQLSGRSRWRMWLALHLAATGLMYWFTARLFAQANNGVAPTRESALLWLGMVFGMLAAWALAIFPASAWPRLAWQGRWAVLGGVPLGAVATLAAWVSGRVGWKFLGQATISLVHGLLALVYPETIYDLGTMTVGTSDFAVDVVATCSGYQGIGLISVFLGAYLWCFRNRFRFPRALLLLPLGIGSIWLANILRIFFLIVIGASGWPDIAQGGFHSQAGWLAFNAVALGFVAFAGNSRYLNSELSLAPAASEPNAATAYLSPFLGVVLSAMLTAVLVQDFDWYYPVRVVVGGALLFKFRRSYDRLSWTFSWRPFLLAAVAFGSWMWLVPVGESVSPVPPSPDLMPSWLAAVWLTVKTLGYVVVSPVVEELAFRGYLMRRLVSSDFQSVQSTQLSWTALFVSSLLFGALHGSNWLPASVAGVAFGAAYYQRGKLSEAILCHSLVNGLVAAYVFATGNWYLWG